MKDKFIKNGIEYVRQGDYYIPNLTVPDEATYIPSLNADKLLEVLKNTNNGFVYQKCGYILEGLNDSLHLLDSFFIECEKHISNAKRYLTKDHTGYIRHKKWKLFAPENIKSMIDKGVSDYDAI